MNGEPRGCVNFKALLHLRSNMLCIALDGMGQGYLMVEQKPVGPCKVVDLHSVAGEPTKVTLQFERIPVFLTVESPEIEILGESDEPAVPVQSNGDPGAQDRVA